MSKTKFPVVAGILEIILACISMFLGSMALTPLLRMDVVWAMRLLSSQIALGLFGLVTFLVGLVGGILAIRRIRFLVALTGAFLLMVWGFLFDWFVISTPLRDNSFIQGLMFGNLMILLSIVDIALLFTSKAGFT
ncbi:MAG: hypothetical protein ACE5L6_01840 [Candidatus Bathyarchaeia archaeon]